MMNFFRFRKIGFKKWCELNELHSKINTAEVGKFSELVIAYTSAVLFLPRFILHRLFWIRTLSLFVFAEKFSAPKLKLPILTTKHIENDKKLSWDYPERTWYYYSHLLAQNYGWTLQQIANLSVEDAIAHVQEVLTTEQLRNEFVYSLSEVAYPYNKSTKTSIFKPLKRPYWMLADAPEIKKVKMLKSLVPVGNVIDSGGMQAALEKIN